MVEESNDFICEASIASRLKQLRIGRRSRQLLANMRISKGTTNRCGGMCIKPNGDIILADSGRNRVFSTNLSGGIEVLLGSGEYGFGISNDPRCCLLGRPRGVALQGESLFIADTDNKVIRVFDGHLKEKLLFGHPGEIGSLDGDAQHCRFTHPTDMTKSPDGLLVADGQRLRLIKGNVVSTLFETDGQIMAVTVARNEIVFSETYAV